MKAENRGMVQVDRVEDCGSYAILAQIFLHQTPPQHKKPEERACGPVSWTPLADQEVELSGNYAGRGPECFLARRGLPAVWQSHPDAWGRSRGAHSLLAERFSERPGAVKGAPAGASEAALDGEDRSGRFAARREWPPPLRRP